VSELQAIILGIVEGLSEFLPISSTGHLVLTSHALGIEDTEFVKTFEIVIQLGAILSVVALYWRSLLVNWSIMKRIIVAFIPTAILGLFFYKIIKEHLLGNPTIVVWALALGGLFLIIFELLHKEKADAAKKVEELSYRQAALIGLSQTFAFVPGVSRSASTIVGGLMMNISRTTVVEMSFLLAVPTMAAATGLDLIKSGLSFSSDQALVLALGFVTSFIVALASIKFLLKFIKHHTFIGFGIYRVVIALAYWKLLL